MRYFCKEEKKAWINRLYKEDVQDILIIMRARKADLKQKIINFKGEQLNRYYKYQRALAIVDQRIDLLVGYKDYIKND